MTNQDGIQNLNGNQTVIAFRAQPLSKESVTINSHPIELLQNEFLN